MANELGKQLLGAGGAGLNIGIDKLAASMKTTIAMARPPVVGLPPLFTTVEGTFRPGLSAIALTSSVVTRLVEAGIETSTLPDGSEPQVTKFVRIIIEEIIKELQLNVKGMIEIPPGTLMGQAGPVPVISTVPIQGSAIIL